MENFDAYKRHILATIERSPIGREPFHHMFIEGIFPDELYAGIKAKALHHKYHAPLQPRLQDNKQFTNDRYTLFDNDDIETRYVRGLFSDDEIKHSLLRKFFVGPDQALVRSLTIHEEFEYVYTAKGRFQNIHVDIPAKFLSFVFYFPEGDLGDEERRCNATILYDRELSPHYKARYTDNSVCIFAPHFHSYHGFSSTVDRTALVMFYVHGKLREKHRGVTRPEAFKDIVQRKLEAHPLLEYGADRDRIAVERKLCRINAPRGRVMQDGD